MRDRECPRWPTSSTARSAEASRASMASMAVASSAGLWRHKRRGSLEPPPYAGLGAVGFDLDSRPHANELRIMRVFSCAARESGARVGLRVTGRLSAAAADCWWHLGGISGACLGQLVCSSEPITAEAWAVRRPVPRCGVIPPCLWPHGKRGKTTPAAGVAGRAKL
jgi:hypothetical protein